MSRKTFATEDEKDDLALKVRTAVHEFWLKTDLENSAACKVRLAAICEILAQEMGYSEGLAQMSGTEPADIARARSKALKEGKKKLLDEHGSDGACEGYKRLFGDVFPN